MTWHYRGRRGRGQRWRSLTRDIQKLFKRKNDFKRKNNNNNGTFRYCTFGILQTSFDMVNPVCTWFLGPQRYTICHCHMASLRSEQYLQFSGASGILSQHLAREDGRLVCEKTVGEVTFLCSLKKDYVWSVYDVTKCYKATQRK